MQRLSFRFAEVAVQPVLTPLTKRSRMSGPPRTVDRPGHAMMPAIALRGVEFSRSSVSATELAQAPESRAHGLYKCHSDEVRTMTGHRHEPAERDDPLNVELDRIERAVSRLLATEAAAPLRARLAHPCPAAAARVAHAAAGVQRHGRRALAATLIGDVRAWRGFSPLGYPRHSQPGIASPRASWGD